MTDTDDAQGDGKRLPVRVGGSVAAGIAFLAVLLATSDGERDRSAWGLGLVAAVLVVAVVLVGVRLAARPGRPPRGRTTADYLALLTGTTAVAMFGVACLVLLDAL